MSHYGPTPDRRVNRPHAGPPPSLPPRQYPTTNQLNSRNTVPSSNQPNRAPRMPHVRQPTSDVTSSPFSRPQYQSSYLPPDNALPDSYRGYNSASSYPVASYPRPQQSAYDDQLESVSAPPAPLRSSAHPTHRHHRSQQRSERTPQDLPRPTSPSKLKRHSFCSPRLILLSIAGCVLLLVLCVVLSSSPLSSLSSLLPSRQPTVVKHSRPSEPAGGASLLDVGDVAAPHPMLHTMAVQDGEEVPPQAAAAATEVAAADVPIAQAVEAAAEVAQQEAANQPATPPQPTEVQAAEVPSVAEVPAAAQPEAAIPVAANAVEEPAAVAAPTPSNADVPTPPAPAAAASPVHDAPAAATPATPDAAPVAPAPAAPVTPVAVEVAAAVSLSYQPNIVMTNSLFPKTADGYPLFSSPAKPQYSYFYCIGGRGRENSQGDRSCRWQNLCYRPADNQWLFYQDPATKGEMPILLDHGVIVSEFPKQFLNLRSMGNPPDAQYWAPTQVYSAIPEGAMVPRRVAERPDVHLLYHPHYPSNIGHVLGDDFFPLFNLQLSFNMLSNDNQLLMVRSCDDIFLPGAPKKAAACHKFMAMLTPGMTDRPYLAATQPDLRERLGVKADAELVCFENVLTGNGPWGFQQSLGKSPSWWQYHAFYLSNMGVPYNHTPKKHRITVSIKDGKRSLYNNQEMVEHLKKTFPSYEVDAIELYQLGGWKQELTYLLDTTVLITPCGGVSMSSMFLPHGSAMIVVDFWDVLKGNTKGMEERLWSNLGYVRPFHYPFVESEVVLEEEAEGKKGLKRSEPQDMRDWGRVRVDVVRMEKIVRAAIAHVDSFMVMGQE